MKNSRVWYRFQNAADDPTISDLYIYDDIGKSWWDDTAVSAKQFLDELNALPATILTARVHVNSLGGDVFDGVAIANGLRAWAKNGRSVTTIVDGIAASTASIVIQAGDTVQIGDNAMVFVHNPWTIVMGNAKEMRKAANDLDARRRQHRGHVQVAFVVE
jgi:ATP-dependent Clp protease protease subunit